MQDSVLSTKNTTVPGSSCGAFAALGAFTLEGSNVSESRLCHAYAIGVFVGGLYLGRARA